jgi:hypothetical protein
MPETGKHKTSGKQNYYLLLIPEDVGKLDIRNTKEFLPDSMALVLYCDNFRSHHPENVGFLHFSEFEQLGEVRVYKLFHTTPFFTFDLERSTWAVIKSVSTSRKKVNF